MPAYCDRSVGAPTRAGLRPILQFVTLEAWLEDYTHCINLVAGGVGSDTSFPPSFFASTADASNENKLTHAADMIPARHATPPPFTLVTESMPSAPKYMSEEETQRG